MIRTSHTARNSIDSRYVLLQYQHVIRQTGHIDYLLGEKTNGGGGNKTPTTSCNQSAELCFVMARFLLRYFFCKISTVVVCHIKIDIRVAANHNKCYLPVLSIHATCFDRTDHPKAFKHTILKPKIECTYILITSLYVTHENLKFCPLLHKQIFPVRKQCSLASSAVAHAITN